MDKRTTETSDWYWQQGLLEVQGYLPLLLPIPCEEI